MTHCTSFMTLSPSGSILLRIFLFLPCPSPLTSLSRPLSSPIALWERITHASNVMDELKSFLKPLKISLLFPVHANLPATELWTFAPLFLSTPWLCLLFLFYPHTRCLQFAANIVCLLWRGLLTWLNTRGPIHVSALSELWFEWKTV